MRGDRLAGSALGRRLAGQALLAAFAILMVVVAVLMLLRRDDCVDRIVRLSRGNAPALVGTGLVVGALSGSFGIGGGFLIVPGLIFATGMPMLQAIGTSLVAVSVRLRMREGAHSPERHRPAPPPGHPRQYPEWVAGWMPHW